MLLRIWAVLLCFGGTFLQASKKVELISDFDISEAFYSKALQSQGLDWDVTRVSIKKYNKAKKVKNLSLRSFLPFFGWSEYGKIKIDDNVEKIIFFNISEKLYQRYDLSLFPKEKMVLFMWEPKTVHPHTYTDKIWSCFSKVYTWDDDLCDEVKFFKFFYPSLKPVTKESISFKEKKLCTLVASDLYSHVDGELYSARRHVVEYFEKLKESGFLFFGRKWDPKKYSLYGGEVEDKISAIAKFRFCFCYENTWGTAGYITEKIFDCFAAGTIPIYLGASNIEKYIPKACFIDRRDFTSLEELHSFLLSMTCEEYIGRIALIREFLESERAQYFTESFLSQAFFNAVAL